MKFKVSFEIEGTKLADGLDLNEPDLRETILMVLDREHGPPVFDENLDATISQLQIERLGPLHMGLSIQDGDGS